jgi:hypothetical protein
VVEFCEREQISATLPCYQAAHKYRGKTAVFRKPLFPGYVFLQLLESQRRSIYQSDYVANLLDVVRPGALQESTGRNSSSSRYRLRNPAGAGRMVRECACRSKIGPLRGIEGWVEERYGMNTELLRLDFIGQAAAVKVEATDLELI